MPAVQSNTAWPTTKANSPPKGASACVLLTTGAMNPLHRGHVEMLNAAAARLEEAGFFVCAIYLSPSHDSYVQPKARRFKTIGLSGRFRLEVARRAVAEDPRVMVASWEADYQGHWPDFPVVCKACQSTVQSDATTANASVFYVCGTDHATKCGLWQGMRGVGVVVVPRATETVGRERPSDRVFVAHPAAGDVSTFSSTKLRAALAAADEATISKMLSAGAAQLLLRPTAAEHAAFKRDYQLLGVAAPSEDSGSAAAPSEGADSGALPHGSPSPSLEALVSQALSHENQQLVVGVTGATRAGKGWTSKALKAALTADVGGSGGGGGGGGGRGRVTIVCQDAFWRRSVELKTASGTVYSEEEPECTDQRAFLAAIRAAKASSRVTIVEGFTLLHQGEVAAELTHAFFLEISRDEARRRRTQNKNRRLNTNPQSEQHFDAVTWPAHTRYVARSVTPLVEAGKVVTLPSPSSDADVAEILRTVMTAVTAVTAVASVPAP